MTVSEFKDLYPDKAHLQGEELWNAMEDSLLQKDNVWHKGDPDIELSEEDELIYQKYKKANDKSEFRVINYTRIYWKAFDKPSEGKPTSSYSFMVLDVSDKTKDNVE